MRIKAINLKEEGTLEFGDFNVIIGGNSVGKTTLMLELFDRADNRQRSKWYWFKQNEPIQYEFTDPIKDLQLLFGSMAWQNDGANRYYYSQSLKNSQGDIDNDGRYRFNSEEHKTVSDLIEKANKTEAENLLRQWKYARPLITFASCEARLKLPSSTAITALSQSPQNAVNVLYRNKVLFRQIDEKIHKQFNMHLAMLDHARTQLDLGLSQDTSPRFEDEAEDLQKEFLRIDTWKDSNFFSIEAVGHGIRSMVNMLMSLLDPVSEVVFIDEPELYIYPAQKRWLGKQLVNLAQIQGKQVFMVTHDPIILQGILDEHCNTHFLRIDIGEDRHRILKECTLQGIDEVSARRNQDSYLQGLFYQRCIAVEGATDRGFYQTMLEELEETRIENKDVGFVACGGKGASVNVAYINSQVGLKCTFIYDFDVLLFDIPVLRTVSGKIGKTSNHEKLDALESFLRKTFTDEKSIKDTGAHKQGLGNQFVRDNLAYFQDAINELKLCGIFIVPNGTLESWAPEVEEKTRFAEIAPAIVINTAALKEPLKGFLGVVLAFLGC